MSGAGPAACATPGARALDACRKTHMRQRHAGMLPLCMPCAASAGCMCDPERGMGAGCNTVLRATYHTSGHPSSKQTAVAWLASSEGGQSGVGQHPGTVLHLWGVTSKQFPLLYQRVVCACPCWRCLQCVLRGLCLASSGSSVARTTCMCACTTTTPWTRSAPLRRTPTTSGEGGGGGGGG